MEFNETIPELIDSFVPVFEEVQEQPQNESTTGINPDTGQVEVELIEIPEEHLADGGTSSDVLSLEEVQTISEGALEEE